jgi:hypothetical protein
MPLKLLLTTDLDAVLKPRRILKSPNYIFKIILVNKDMSAGLGASK